MDKLSYTENYLLYANKTYNMNLPKGVSVTITPSEDLTVIVSTETPSLVFYKLPEYGQ